LLISPLCISHRFNHISAAIGHATTHASLDLFQVGIRQFGHSLLLPLGNQLLVLSLHILARLLLAHPECSSLTSAVRCSHTYLTGGAPGEIMLAAPLRVGSEPTHQVLVKLLTPRAPARGQDAAQAFHPIGQDLHPMPACHNEQESIAWEA